MNGDMLIQYDDETDIFVLFLDGRYIGEFITRIAAVKYVYPRAFEFLNEGYAQESK